MRGVTEPIITDHALIRWLERLQGIDLTVFREEIAAITRRAVSAGACSVTKDRFRYCLAGATVVTVKPRNVGRAPGRTGKRLTQDLHEMLREGIN